MHRKQQISDIPQAKNQPLKTPFTHPTHERFAGCFSGLDPAWPRPALEIRRCMARACVGKQKAPRMASANLFTGNRESSPSFPNGPGSVLRRLQATSASMFSFPRTGASDCWFSTSPSNPNPKPPTCRGYVISRHPLLVLCSSALSLRRRWRAATARELGTKHWAPPS